MIFYLNYILYSSIITNDSWEYSVLHKTIIKFLFLFYSFHPLAELK